MLMLEIVLTLIRALVLQIVDYLLMLVTVLLLEIVLMLVRALVLQIAGHQYL